MNLKYVNGYLTGDGKFFEEYADAEMHERKIIFIDMYNRSNNKVLYAEDLDVEPERIYDWLNSMSNYELDHLRAMLNHMSLHKAIDEEVED